MTYFSSNPVGDDVVDPSQFPTAVLTVPDANPIWAYCKQGNHCQQGMVFAVNPGTEFDAFKAAATGGASSTAPTATAPATTTAAPPASTTAAGAAATHTVVVGGPGVLAFNPSNVPANVGDTIVFQFKQKNHTVTQSTFDAPCRAIAATSSTGQIGFDSGFVPVADGATDFPTFSVQVNSTTPVWAYCRQATHCGQGMVFAVNAPTTGSQSFDAFVNLAKSLNGTSGNNGGYGGGNGGDSNGAVGAFVSGRLGVAVSVVALFLGVML
jgi:plastocyanin